MVTGTLVVALTGPEVWAVGVVHLLVELGAESLVVVGTGPDVWVVKQTAGTED